MSPKCLALSPPVLSPGSSHLLGVLPPPLPLVGVVGCDGQVPDGSVEPHVEHLGEVTPEQVTPVGRAQQGPPRQRTWGRGGPTLSRKPSRGTEVPQVRSRVMQRGLSPSRSQVRVMCRALAVQSPVAKVCSSQASSRPSSCGGHRWDTWGTWGAPAPPQPSPRGAAHLGQVQEQVLGGRHHRGTTADLALGVLRENGGVPNAGGADPQRWSGGTQRGGKGRYQKWEGEGLGRSPKVR